MKAPWTPMRWPSAWTDPATLDLLKGSGIDTLLLDNSAGFDAVRTRAMQLGLRIFVPAAPPEGIRIIKGEWPGVRSMRSGGGGAGPTGVAWVDSNGWAVQLAAVLHADQAAWIDAPPPKQTFPSAYLTAVADAAAYGGRWIVTLDDTLAAGIQSGAANALTAWKTLSQATAFFAGRQGWTAYQPAAVFGVVSDFAGGNEFFSNEVLNLLARAGGHYRIIPKDSLNAASLRGLRAVLYADEKAPSAALRKEVAAFVQAGGMLITTPVWGPPAGSRDDHPRFQVAAAGKGRVAIAIAKPDDPFQFANDAVVVLSHRYDLVRFWNAGAAGSYYAVSPDGKQAVVHLLFYANRGPDSATVRVAGPFRKVVKASTVDAPELAGVKSETHKDAVEIYLPQVSQYVALELSI